MSTYQIVTDSSCDIPPELLKEYGVDFVPYSVSFDGSTYYKEHVDMNVTEFYHRMTTGKAFPKTSLPPIQDYIDCFEPYLKQGQDILCVCLTAKFSGSYQSAINAGHMLKDDYPGRRVIVLDSIQVTAGQGLLVFQAAKMQQAGFGLDQCVNILEQVKETCRISFTVDSLEYLRRGGRIGLVAGFAGSLLNIKPIIQVYGGELRPHSKVRGRKKAISEVIRIAMSEFGDHPEHYEFAVISSECPDEALEIVHQLKTEYGVEIAYPLINVGMTIGCHIGPSAIGIATIRKYTYFA